MGSGGRIARDSKDRIIVEAVRNVSQILSEGDRVGIIGHNGAGKSSLLRLLAGIYEPTAGRIIRQGHITPLFDASLGMDLESTGFENIFLRGLFLNLDPEIIRERTAEIAEFTELGGYLDMPVSTYSTGMRMRLAFGVSTCVDPEILLVDEIFGAGDAKFQAKAKKRMVDLVDRSSILVMASHAMPTIKQICNRAILLDRGEIVAMGDPDEVEAAYLKLANQPPAAAET